MDFQGALSAGIAAQGLRVEPEVVLGLARHFEVLVKWAARINITTVLEPEEAAIVHGLDCLLLAECFDPADTSAVLDVGSGGGFPGVVLALARPRLRLSLLEPQRKRASFLRVALTELRRPDVRVVEGRLEPVGPRHPPLLPDVIVSRATIPPLALAALAGPHLPVGGRLYLMSGAGAPSPEALDAAGRPGGLVHLTRFTHTLPGGQTRFIDRLERPGPRPRESR